MTSRRHLAVLASASVLALAGCGGSWDTVEGGGPGPGASGSSASAASLLAEHDLDGLDARAVIDRLDRMPVAERPADLMASVRPTKLLLSDPSGGAEEALAMPEDGFYLSAAPYSDETHECFYHSLTTCQGELSEEEVDVRVESADGEVLLDETMTTFDNGFVGMWLPRDVDATLTVTRGEEEGSAQITTGEDDLTCLTTLELT